MTTALPKHVDFQLPAWAEFEQADQAWVAPTGLIQDTVLSYALTEGSGAALDGSSNGNDTSSALNWVTGDATYDPHYRVDLTNDNTLPDTGIAAALAAPHTVVAAVRLDTTSSDQQVLFGWREIPSDYMVYIQNRVMAVFVREDGINSFLYRAPSGAPLAASTWYTLEWYIDPGTPANNVFRVDGVDVGSLSVDFDLGTVTSLTPRTDNLVGLGVRLGDTTPNVLDGDVGFLHIINRAITADERANTDWRALGT